MEKVNIQSKPLFLINVTDKWSSRTFIATQKTIDYHASHKTSKVTIIENLGEYVPNCEVFIESVTERRCFCSVTYKVIAEKALNDTDFEVLRALGCFLLGQISGELLKSSEENGKFNYTLLSERDSGD
jgi:hypothetical protein